MGLNGGGGYAPSILGKIKLVAKTADETVNSSTTLQNDDELSFEVGANERWAFMLVFRYNSGSTPDIKLSWTIPSGSMGWHIQGGNQGEFTTSTSRTEAGTGANRLISYNGFVLVGSTGGTVQLQWAQNVSDAGDTTVKEGSYIIAWRIR